MKKLFVAITLSVALAAPAHAGWSDWWARLMGYCWDQREGAGQCQYH